MAAVDQHISYMKELYAGDVISVHTGVLEIKEKSIRFVHEMHHDVNQEMVARTILKAVHLDTRLRKSCAFPADVALRAQPWMVTDVL